MMIKRFPLSVPALALAGLLAFASGPALAAAGAKPEAQDWSFHGMFGTYDRGALQRGFQIYREVCAACHSNKLIAPDISLVFERPIASVAGYEYSPAMKQMARGGVRWSAEFLDHFLATPTKAVPGTKMGFQGLLNVSDRQAIISYLKGLKNKK